MRPNTFKAAVLSIPGEPLEICDMYFPKLASGQVLVKLISSTVCASQLFEIAGKRGKDKFLPHMLGHEGFGIVEELGAEVSRFKQGDEIILTWVQQGGLESAPISFLDINRRVVNAGKVTTFAEYAVVSENRLFHAPKCDPRILPLLGCAALTGVGMVIEVPCKSNRALVIGGGGVGIFTILKLLSDGVENIHVVEKSKERRKKILQISQHIKVYSSLSDNELIAECHEQGVFEEVYEATGDIEALQLSLSLVETPGILIFASHPEVGGRIQLDPHELIKGKRVLGTWGGGCSELSRRETAIEVFTHWQELLKDFVSEPIRLEQINEYLFLESIKPTGRLLIGTNL